RADDPLSALTPREREVLAAMAEGRTNVGIARLLSITEGATEKHISNIFGKLELPTRRTTTGACLPFWPTLDPDVETEYTAQEVAVRAQVEPGEVDRFVGLGLIEPDA